MKAMILAAGRGNRLRPLTDTVPKPLVEVGTRTLIDRHLDALATAGFDEVVVNTSHLAEKIESHLSARSSRPAIQIAYEGESALETGGGMLNAIQYFNNSPWLAVNADIVTDYPFETLRHHALRGLAHLVLVNNPDYRDGGDFSMNEACDVSTDTTDALTFSGIGLYHPDLLKGAKPGKFSIVPRLKDAMSRGEVTGEHYRGQWFDTGTPERLAATRRAVKSTPPSI